MQQEVQTFVVSAQQKAKLESIAKRDFTSISAIVRKAIEDYFSKDDLIQRLLKQDRGN